MKTYQAEAPILIGPTTRGHRIDMLDVLRGAALLGIVLANMISLSLYLYLPAPEVSGLPTAGPDRVLDFLELVLVEGKFYTIFSILFGIGFSILLRNRMNRGERFIAFFLWRMFLLFLIGMLHALLVWHNDILQAYAICGMALLLVVRAPSSAVLVLSATLVALPPIFSALHIFPESLFLAQRDALKASFGLAEQSTLAIRSEHGFVQNVQLNAALWFSQLNHLVTSGMIFRVLGLFLFGYWLGRLNLAGRIQEFREVYKWVAVAGIIVGLPLNIFYAHTFYAGGLLHEISAALGASLLALGYIAALSLAFQSGAGSTLTGIFAPVGRMALTNYVAQSLIGILVFYGIGLGLGGSVGPSIYLPIGIAIFVWQIIVSRLWLARFRFGPLEWMWRCLSYGRSVPLIARNP